MSMQFAVDGAGNMVKKNIPSKVRDFLMDYEKHRCI